MYCSHSMIYMPSKNTTILASLLSVKWAVQAQAQYDPFVSERWNSTRMLSIAPTSADDWFTKAYPCVIMSM